MSVGLLANLLVCPTEKLLHWRATLLNSLLISLNKRESFCSTNVSAGDICWSGLLAIQELLWNVWLTLIDLHEQWHAEATQIRSDYH